MTFTLLIPILYLVDTNPNVVAAVNENGLKLQEYGTDNLYHPKAVTSTEGIEPVDLIILFVKALFSKAALAGNKALIGPNTYVLTLQNGSGHEDILGEFVDLDHIIIGTTEDNGAVLGMGYIRHGGEGNTNVGMLVEDKEGFLPKLKESLQRAHPFRDPAAHLGQTVHQRFAQCGDRCSAV